MCQTLHPDCATFSERAEHSRPLLLHHQSPTTPSTWHNSPESSPLSTRAQRTRKRTETTTEARRDRMEVLVHCGMLTALRSCRPATLTAMSGCWSTSHSLCRLVCTLSVRKLNTKAEISLYQKSSQAKLLS